MNEDLVRDSATRSTSTAQPPGWSLPFEVANARYLNGAHQQRAVFSTIGDPPPWSFEPGVLLAGRTAGREESTMSELRESFVGAGFESPEGASKGRTVDA